MLKTIEVDVELPGVQIRSSELEETDGGDGFFTRIGLRCMLERKDYRIWHRVHPVLAALIAWNTREERTASPKKFHICHSEIVCDVTGQKQEQALIEKAV